MPLNLKFIKVITKFLKSIVICILSMSWLQLFPGHLRSTRIFLIDYFQNLFSPTSLLIIFKWLVSTSTQMTMRSKLESSHNLLLQFCVQSAWKKYTQIRNNCRVWKHKTAHIMEPQEREQIKWDPSRESLEYPRLASIHGGETLHSQ